jgi:hypothetical protein
MKLQLHPFYFLFAILILINGCSDDSGNPTSTDLQDKQLVSTPFGPMDKSRVYHIEEGYQVKVEQGHLLKIESATGKVVQDLGELVTQTKNSNNAGRTESNDPWDNSNDIISCSTGNNLNHTNFSASITVPVAPTQNTETLFIGMKMLIFTPFQSQLYTVLQYGPSAAGGGQYWSAACWQLFNGVATHSTIVNNISPGTVLFPRIQYQSNQYVAYFSNYSNSITYTTALTSSGIQFWLGGYPKTTGAYPNQFSANFTDVKVQTGLTYPTLSWSPGTSGSFGEQFKVISNSNTIGQVNLCFYGTPTNPNYPNNTVYPLTFTWTGTPGATSYDVSYYVIDHSGNQTNYTGSSTGTSYTFPFVKGYCQGCDLISRVRANYAGGVVSDWGPYYNTILY